MDFKPRQIYSIIFQKEYYPCNRFEIGNNINKKVCNIILIWKKWIKK